MTTTEPFLFTVDPRRLVGAWRRFGSVGPVYEIAGVDHVLEDGDRIMRIRVLESGEGVDYRLTHLLDDPKAD